MNRLRVAAVVFGAGFLLTTSAWSQSGEDESGLQERAESRGFKAESVFEVGDIDTVNLFNGNLTLNIPIGQEYSANGNLDYSLVLSYNSNVWDIRERLVSNPPPPCGGPGRCSSEHYLKGIPNPLSNAGLGWTLSLGRLFAPHVLGGGANSHTLSIDKQGGPGYVESFPKGIDCGDICEAGFAPGTTVSLAAEGATGYIFKEWQGPEDCLDGTVDMDAPKTCTAVFEPGTPTQYKLTVAIDWESTGSGVVTSSPGGINCPPTCEAYFDEDELVDLHAEPDAGSLFVQWLLGKGNECYGTVPDTQILMWTDRRCHARFDSTSGSGPYTLTVTAGGPFGGSVFVTLPGQSSQECFNTTCTYQTNGGDVVQIGDQPANCSLAAAYLEAECATGQVVMTGNKKCTAWFPRDPMCPLSPASLGEPVNDKAQWMYATPDGAKHLFYDQMQPNEDDEDPNVHYSRDNTYLRLKTAASQKVLEFPDGTKHYFNDSGDGVEYRLTKIVDAFGNSLDIAYSLDGGGNEIWSLQDSTGRLHTVTFDGSSSLGQQVDKIELAAFGNQTATYDFVYDTIPIERTCRDNDPDTSQTLVVPLLTEIQLPEGGRYEFRNAMGDPAYITECSGSIPPPNSEPPSEGHWKLEVNPTSPPNSGGTITSSPGAIDCTRDWESGVTSGVCEDEFELTESVSLTLVPSGGASTWQWTPNSDPECYDPSILGLGGQTITCEAVFFPSTTSPFLQGEPNVDGSPGSLLAAQLPTRGRIEWDYGFYVLPAKNKPYIQGLAGVVERRHYDRNSSVPLGTWTYNNDVNEDPPFVPDWPTAASTDVVYPTGDCTRHYFSGNAGSFTWDWAYGLPFSHELPEAEGRYRSTEVYESSTSEGLCSGQLLRTTAVEYDKDGEVPPPLILGFNDHDAAKYNRNRRLKQSITIFHDDGGNWIKTVNSDFDSLGHYQRSVTEGSLEPNDRRVSYTDYILDQTPATTQPWLLTRFDYQETTEAPVTARVDSQFVEGTGFLQCRRTRVSTGGRSDDDVVVEFTNDGLGNVAREKWHGGDTNSAGTNSVCAQGSHVYAIDHTYDSGSLATSKYAGAPGDFFSYDATIDPNTGLASATRDTAGIQTNFDYDLEGRLVEVEPPDSACTEYTYFNATQSQPAKVNIKRRLNTTGCTSTTLAEEELWFDGFGRVETERRKFPGTGFLDRTTTYNARGWKLSVSEWGAPSKTTLFQNYDPFGRAGKIIAPDQNTIDFDYTGNRLVDRTTKVWTGSSEESVTTTERYDSFGRLLAVTEPSAGGQNFTTTYEYDVGNRLETVTMGQQTRTFDYDLRGFLESESHPEKTSAVTYSDYDPKGHAGHKNDNGTDLYFNYDAAERLTEVRKDQSDSGILKKFTYGTAQNNALGKLKKARRNNYAVSPLTQEETNFWIEEEYFYGGMDGRVSRRDSVCHPYKLTQTFTYDDLGGVKDLGYPECEVFCVPPGNQTRTVTYSYNQGRVSQVVDSDPSIGDWIPQGGVTYNSNGTWATVLHSNGVTDHQTIDPDSMRRPRRLATTGVTPETANWDSGVYAYDGSGNITAMGSDAFAYDEVSRIVTSTVSGNSQDYSYDAYGNLTSITTTRPPDPPEPRNVPADAATNRLSGHLYDARGNLQFWGAQECHVYDEFNQVKEVRSGGCSGPVVRAYAYTADGERILTVHGDSDEAEFTLRDLDGKVLREFLRDLATESTAITLENVWMEGRLVGFVDEAGQEVHAHLDHLGTPRLHTDATGAELSEHDYFPFGEEVTDPAQDEIPMKFTGHERDRSALGTAAELDYMHARYYSAHWGRFTSVDPGERSFRLNLSQTWNRYSYARGNPLKLVDPDGRDAFSVFAGLAEALEEPIESFQRAGSAALRVPILKLRLRLTGTGGKLRLGPVQAKGAIKVTVDDDAKTNSLSLKATGELGGGIAGTKLAASGKLEGSALLVSNGEVLPEGPKAEFSGKFKTGPASLDDSGEVSGEVKVGMAEVKVGVDLGEAATAIGETAKAIRQTIELLGRFLGAGPTP